MAAKQQPGRPVSKETKAIRKKILRFAKKGITNPDLAKKLGVTTMQSQSMCKPLVKSGDLEISKVGNLNHYLKVESELLD